MTLAVAILGSAYLIVSILIGMPPVIVVGLPVAILLGTGGLILVSSRRASTSFATAASAMTSLSLVMRASVATIVLLIVSQVVPYGRDHSNPPVTGEPQWASAETRELMVRACYSCHSNEIDRPWYASVAPISWMVQAHIDEGREEVNYSEFLTNKHGADETLEVILDGSMPPTYFTRFGLHPEARLTDQELQALIAGVRATPGLSERDDDQDG